MDMDKKLAAEIAYTRACRETDLACVMGDADTIEGAKRQEEEAHTRRLALAKQAKESLR